MEIGHPVTKDLHLILKDVDDGTIKIPEFQRDFRWDVSNIADLAASLLKGYPAGVLLFWDVSDKEKKLLDRIVEGVDEKAVGKTTKFQILDGQQRITSLYQLTYKDFVKVRGGRKIKFFLDLDALGKGEVDDCVQYFTERETKKKKLDNENEQCKLKLMPLNLLLGEPRLRDWKHKYVLTRLALTSTSSADQSKLAEKIEKKKNEFDSTFLDKDKPLDNLRSYRFHVVTLPPTLSMDAVTTIFEKLNTTGQVLNIFEILTATLYSEVNLRKLWLNAREEHKLLDEFSKDERDTSLAIWMLRAILLKKSHDDPKMKTLECKRKNLLENLEAGDIRRYWASLAESFDKSLNKLREECGCASLSYLPYSPILVPFSLSLNHIEKKLKVHERAKAFRGLERWYWTSVFGERYDSSTDSKSKSDTNALIAWFDHRSKAPPEMTDFDCEDLDLRNTTGGAIYKGVLNILLKNGIRDFCSNQRISAMVKRSPSDVDVHHIFPDNYVKKVFGEGSQEYKMADSILNKTLIENETNRQYIKNDPPSIYYKRIRKYNPKLDKTLKEHLIPIQEFKSDEFSDFIGKRQRCIIDEIKEAVGAS